MTVCTGRGDAKSRASQEMLGATLLSRAGVLGCICHSSGHHNLSSRVALTTHVSALSVTAALGE